MYCHYHLYWHTIVKYTIWEGGGDHFEWLEFGFEYFEFGFGCFESLWNGSTPFRMVRIWIRMLRVPFEWFEFTIECFESLLNG